MKLYAHQKKRLDKLTTRYKESVKGKTKTHRERIKREYLISKTVLLQDFKDANLFHSQQLKERKQQRAIHRKQILDFSPLKRVELQDGSYFEVYEFRAFTKLSNIKNEVDSKILEFFDNPNVKYCHLIGRYKDEQRDHIGLFSHAFNRKQIEMLKSGFTNFAIKKFTEMAKQRESDFSIDKVQKLFLKVIYNGHGIQNNEQSKTPT